MELSPVLHTHLLEPPDNAGGVRTVWQHFLDEMLKYLKHQEGVGVFPKGDLDLVEQTGFPYYQGYSVDGWSQIKDDFDRLEWIEKIQKKVLSNRNKDIPLILHHFPIATEVFKNYKEKLVVWWHANEFFSKRNNPERKFNKARIRAEIKAIANSRVLITNTETERQQTAEDYCSENFVNKLKRIYGEDFKVEILEGYNLLTKQEILNKTIVVPLGVDSDKFSPEYKAKLPSRSQILKDECPTFYSDNSEFVDNLTITDQQGKEINNPDIEIFGSWGRIAGQKGLEDTIEAFAVAVKSDQYLARNKQGVLMLIGPFDSNSRYFKTLQSLIQKLDIQGKVYFPGSVHGPLAQKLFDVGIQTPKYETFGLSLGEMVASGIPTFINNEQIINEVYPKLISSQSFQILANNILSFLSFDIEEQEKYIKNNQNHVKQSYNWERSYQILIDELEEKGFDLRSKELPLPRYSLTNKPIENIPREFILERRLEAERPLDLVFSDFDGTLRNKDDPEGGFSSYEEESIPAMDNFVQDTKATTGIATARTPLEVTNLIKRTDYNSSTKKYNYMGISIAENGSSLVLPNIPKLITAATELGYTILEILDQPDFKLISLAPDGEIEKMQNIVKKAKKDTSFDNSHYVTSIEAKIDQNKKELLEIQSGHPDIEATERSIFRCGSMYMKIRKESVGVNKFIIEIQNLANQNNYNCFIDEHGSNEFYTLELALKKQDKGKGIATAIEIYKQAEAKIGSIAHIGDETNDFGGFEEALTNPNAETGRAFLVGGPNFGNNQEKLRDKGMLGPDGVQTIETKATEGFREALKKLREEVVV